MAPSEANNPGTPTVEEIRRRVAEQVFGNLLVENSLRGMVVEKMVEMALAPDWRLCSGDWSGWDLDHRSGARIEVKQSSLLQTWDPPAKPAAPRFQIPASKGYFVGAKFVPEGGRKADLYVFAYHGEGDRKIANHWDPLQWLFLVALTTSLPETSSISLRAHDRPADTSCRLQP
jgi:hypothetical protein